MAKKGDISMQVIVIAILSLLVLVILSVMFITKLSAANHNLDTCAVKGGVCKSACADYETNLPFVNCPTSGEKCCVGRDTAQAGGSGDQNQLNN